ncbi:MAG: hypothetical protein RL410_838 [Actinomycetota bacterium]|jgi:hypothetical protein
MRWLRQLINLLTGVTLFGILVGFISRGKPQWNSEYGLLVFFDCRIPWKLASAITFGDVVLLLTPPRRWSTFAEMPPGLLHHEMKHAQQYNFVLGFPYFPLYWLACAYSWIVSGDHWSYNVFESRAGHREGGYQKRSRRGRH